VWIGAGQVGVAELLVLVLTGLKVLTANIHLPQDVASNTGTKEARVFSPGCENTIRSSVDHDGHEN